MRIAILDTSETGGWLEVHGRFEGVAGSLAAAGHEVFLVYASSDPILENLPGVRTVIFARGMSPVLTALNRDIGAGPMIESNIVAHRLAELSPDLVIAPLRGGLAQGILMARACGEAFQATRVALWCNMPSQLHFLHSDYGVADISPLVADALERQSLALADALVLADTRETDGFMRLAGRTLPGFVVAPPAHRVAMPHAARHSSGDIDEIVLVGQHRRSAGLEEFIQVVESLSAAGLMANRTVTFLGPSQGERPGNDKSWLVRRAAACTFRSRIIDRPSRSSARQYLSRSGRLGLSIASEAEELHFARFHGSLHIALLRDPKGRDPFPSRLEAALSAALAGSQPPEPTATEPSPWPSLALAIQALPLPERATPRRGGISICILHHNRLNKLSELLESIPLIIDGMPVEVIVVDNGSEIIDVRRKIVAAAAARPLLRIVELADPLPLATAHNRALAEASFETVIFSDDDNYFAVDGVRRLARALMEGDFDIVVSALDVFDEGTPPPYPTMGRLIFLGAAHSVGLFFNAFGDTAMAVRRDKFLRLGGFHDPGYFYPSRDWVTLAKAQGAGLRIGALQWPAVRYRRDTARSDLGAHKMDHEGARFFVFDVYNNAFNAKLVAGFAQKMQADELYPAWPA